MKRLRGVVDASEEEGSKEKGDGSEEFFGDVLDYSPGRTVAV